MQVEVYKSKLNRIKHFFLSLHIYSLPQWSQTLFPNNEKFYKSALKVFYLPTATKHLAKFSGGFLLKDLLDRFTSKAQHALEPDRKFFIYSTHDFNLFNLLLSLDIFDVSMLRLILRDILFINLLTLGVIRHSINTVVLTQLLPKEQTENNRNQLCAVNVFQLPNHQT